MTLENTLNVFPPFVNQLPDFPKPVLESQFILVGVAELVEDVVKPVSGKPTVQLVGGSSATLNPCCAEEIVL